MIISFLYETEAALWGNLQKKVPITIPAHSYINIESMGVADNGCLILNRGESAIYINEHKGNINVFSGNLPAIQGYFTEFDPVEAEKKFVESFRR
jgi:hypothetical protein